MICSWHLLAIAKYPGLNWLDWIVIGLYGLLMLGVGAYYSRRQENTEEYFVGGRKMRSWLVGLSLFATLLSTISYLAQPGEMIKHGPVILSGMLYVPLVYVIVGYIFIPRFMRLKITSAYEILESQLGPAGRVCGSGIFMATRLVWMSLMIYLAARVMVVVLGLNDESTPLVILLTGLVTVAYTGAGGIQAVVATDVLQFFVLIAGALVTIVLVSVYLGSVTSWIPTSWEHHWDQQPLFSFDPTVRATVVGSIINATMWWICTAASDQMAIQRYASTPNASAARRAFLINCIADVMVAIILAAVGFALLAFFRSQAPLEGSNLLERADYLFPDYIAKYVPAGLGGLIIAGMFAAAMSSLSSGINSTVTVLTVDFMDRFRAAPATPAGGVKRARALSFAIGAAVVLLGTVIGEVPGNIIEVTSKTNGLFVGPLAGLFILAMFVPFSTAFGAIWGAIYGLIVAAMIAYWDVLTGQPALSFQYIIVASLFVHLLTGTALSCISHRRQWSQRGRLAWNIIALFPAILLPIIAISMQRITVLPQPQADSTVTVTASGMSPVPR